MQRQNHATTPDILPAVQLHAHAVVRERRFRNAVLSATIGVSRGG